MSWADLLRIFNSITGYSVAVMFLSAFIGFFIVGLKFDKLFRHLPNPIEPGIPGLNMMARVVCYMGCIVCKNKSSKSKIFSLIYQGYDFRGNSNLLQKLVSFLFFISFLCMVIFGLAVLIIQWLS